MKRIINCLIALILCTSFYVLSSSEVTKANTFRVSTKTSDKLLGNFIESAYNVFYEKKSDLEGFTYWYNNLGTGKITLSNFIERVADSKEFSKNVKLKEDFVEKMYRLIYNEKIDKRVRKNWLKYIDELILKYYRSEYPNSYTDKDILTLRWNINDSPKVIYDVINTMIEENRDFKVISSFMNVKLYENSSMKNYKRTKASEIYKYLDSNIIKTNKEYTSKKVLSAERKSAFLRQKLSNKNKPLNNMSSRENYGFEDLKQEILDYLGDRVNKVSVSFYDINSKESFDINGDVLFKAGSTYKVPLNLVLYDLAYKGKLNLDDKVEYIHSKHYEGGAGVLKNKLENDTLPPQSFKDLSQMSIVHSDNIASNMLRIALGKYVNLYNEYGKILGYNLTRTGNEFTTNEMNEFLKKLYYNEENNPYYKNLINYLKNSSDGVRIGKYIPDNLVASKYGSYDGNYHDIGIVFGDKPFIVSIFTRDVNNQEDIIADIAKIIYESK